MCVFHYQLQYCSDQVMYKVTCCRDYVAALRGDPNATCFNVSTCTDRHMGSLCWYCLGEGRTPQETIESPYNYILAGEERMRYAFEESERDTGLRPFYGYIQDLVRMVQAQPADGHSSLQAMNSPGIYIDRRRLYSIAQDQWIWTRFHTFAAANNGLRMPLPQLVDEFNRTFTHVTRSLRSVETHIFRVPMLLETRNQFRAY